MDQDSNVSYFQFLETGNLNINRVPFDGYERP